MIYWIDLFCGAGGVSLGIHKAGQRVLACINHDKNAILSHSANHKDVLHFTEDIRTIELHPIVKLVQEIRAKDPKAVFALWASLECTNYSKAKGGQSRDADSRTLALHLFRYMEAINFDYIYIENVEEFMAWGSLIAKTEKIKVDGETREVCPLKWNKGKLEPHWIPESKTKGADYIAWIKQVCSYGFHHQHKILNCADFGDPTKRLRYFGIFAKVGKRIVFPAPTHSDPKKIGKAKNLFSSEELKPWIPVKRCLDFSDTGNSIFSRKKPLVEKSLRRIYAGLVKYVMDNDSETQSVCEKIAGDIIATKESIAIPIIPASVGAKPFITKYMSNSPQTGISVPQDIDNPSGTITTQGRFGLVQMRAFLAGYYSSKGLEADKGNINSIDSPSPTLTTIPHHSLVLIENISFINKYYGQADQMQNAISVEKPAPTLTTKDRLSLISTIQYIVNPQYGDRSGCDVDSPCFTLIARMDKMPPYLINGLNLADNDKIAAMLIDSNDSEYMVKIKVCMAIFGLCDIKMRMLNISELKKIQSFPENYVLIGTQAEQKKYIGNAVPSETVKNLVSCLSR